MFAVTSATGSESRQWLKSSGLLTIRPGRVPSLSAYAYQSSVSLLLARLPTHYTATAEPLALTPLQRIERADRFFAATGADIRHGGDRAFYAEGPDYVQMPPFETFHDAESHAATLAHEITHWTKHGKRLARDFGHVRFGDEGYAKEELVAELGSAFLCADLGITPEVRDDHAAYIGHWLKALRDDRRLIFTAAAHAQRAADYLHGLQPRIDTAAARAAA